MAWVAVDEDGQEKILGSKPERIAIFDIWISADFTQYIKLPSGSIKKLINRKLTWEDEPVELK